MVAGADGDAVAVEDLGDVVGVDALDLEGDRADPLGPRRRAEDPQAGDLGEPLERVGGDLALVRRATASIPSASSQRSAAAIPIAWAIAGVPASKRAGGSAQVVPSLVDLADHRAAAEEGRHLAQQVEPAPRARRSRSARRALWPVTA